MRLRTPVLVLASALAAVIVPWTDCAAVPSKPAKQTLACNDGSGKSARVWFTTQGKRLTKLAIDNPCSKHLAYGWGSYGSGDPRGELLVAPGVHFNWGKKRIQLNEVQPGWVHWHDGAECHGPTTVRVVLRYDRVVSTEEAYGIIC